MEPWEGEFLMVLKQVTMLGKEGKVEVVSINCGVEKLRWFQWTQ